MNSFERIMAVIEGRHSDRTPNANIVMQIAAKEIGVSYQAYCKDYRNLVRGNLHCAEKYGIDIVSVMQSPVSESHDLGGSTVFPKDGVPYPEQPLIREKADLLKLKTIEPFEGGMMWNAVQSVRSFCEQVKNQIAIVGWVEGCFAQAADLMGVTEFLIALADEEQRVFIQDLLDFILEQETLYAKAQIRAGADIIGVGDAISSVAGPAAYRELAQQYQYRLLGAIKEMGAKTKLHICGNTLPFIKEIPYTVCDILDVDWMVPLEQAREAAAGRTVLSGNYDPVGVLLQGSEQDVANAVHRCTQIAGKKYFSAGGCEVPKDTPTENLLQVSKALRG